LHNDKTWLANRNTKRNEAIDNVKKSDVVAYLEILSRSDSQYAPLEKKAGEDDLKRFYSLFLDANGQTIAYDKLSINNGRVVELLPMAKSLEVHPDAIYHTMQSFRYYPENNIARICLDLFSRKIMS